MDYIDNDLSLVMESNSKQNNQNSNNSNNFFLTSCENDIVCDFLTVGDVDITQNSNSQEIIQDNINNHIVNNGSSPSSPLRVPNYNSSPFNNHSGIDSSPEFIYDINVQDCLFNQQTSQVLLSENQNQLLDCQYQLFMDPQTIQNIPQQIQQPQIQQDLELQDVQQQLQQEQLQQIKQGEEILNLMEQNIELPLVNGYSMLLSESPSSSSASPLTPSSPGSPFTMNQSPSTTTTTTSTTSNKVNKKSKEEKKTNSKKRTIESRVQNIVHPLTREELLKISGKEPVQIEDTPIHNEHDEKVVKKQRRLIKNRESAQLSRMRKKIYIEDLEKKISDLTQDNNSLKEEVLYLQGLVKQLANNNPNVNVNYDSNLNSNNNNNNSSVIDINTNSVNNNNNNHKQQQSKNVKAAGVCLLLIFFSLGVFFQTPQSQPQFGAITHSPFDVSPSTAKSSHNILSIETTGPSSSSNSISISSQQGSNFIQSSSILLNNNNNNINQKNLNSNNNNNNNNNNININNIKNENNKRIALDDGVYSTGQQQNRKKIKINVGSRFEEIEDSSVIPASTSLSTIIQNQDIDEFRLTEEYDDESTHQESNSQFIVCSDSPRIVSHNITQTTENLLNSNSSNLTIGILLPASSLNLNIGESSILEISCLVSNVRVWNPLSVDNPSSNSQQHYISNHI